MATERVIYIDNGENIDASWLGHLAISWDGVNWETISKNQLDVSARIAKQNADRANRHPGENKGSRALISLKRQGDVRDVLEFDVENVANQAAWQAGASLNDKMLLAVTSITTWLASFQALTIAAAAGAATAANQVLVLAELQKGKDYESRFMKDAGAANLIFREVVIWDQTTSTFGASQYYDSTGATYVPVGAISYVDTEGAIISLLNEVSAVVVRTPSYTNVAGIASSSVAAGARSVSFFNNGPTAATIQGTSLASGKGIDFDAGGENDTLGAITYVTIATGDLDITTVV